MLEGNPELHRRVIDAVVEQFPDSPELANAARTLDGSGVTLLIALAGTVLLATAGWLVLQQVGSAIIGRQVQGSTPTAGVFASALVLLAWMAIQARLTVMAAEINAVLVCHWWPRSLRSGDPGSDHLGSDAPAFVRPQAHTQPRAPTETARAG